VPNPADIPAIEARLSKLSAGDRLCWAAETFGARAGIGTSFQPAGIVILHLAKTQGLNLPAFTLNTGLLFPETLALKTQLEQHLGISIEDLVPEQTVEQQAQTHGAELWKRNPEKCCELRKVAVLGKKLFELDLWITGVRRDQSKERSVTPLLSLAARPDNSDVWKLNPLVDWSREQVWDYIKQHQIPYNVLHDRGYRSIGCAPCTAVTTSDDERSGRWVGFNKTECGLHNRPRPTL
jgi:phosphoadenosine phosphosulfate reductase